MVAVYLFCWALAVEAVAVADAHHYRVTALSDGSFLTIRPNENGTASFEGYLTTMWNQIVNGLNSNNTTTAELTSYEFLAPSGYGSACMPQLNGLNQTSTLAGDNSSDIGLEESVDAYDKRYYSQFNCGSNDVTELQGTPFGTDIYLGMYYVTPERLERNKFTLPFQPPYQSTLGILGTATHISSFEHLINLQHAGKQGPVCVPGSTALSKFVQTTFPDMKIRLSFGEISAIGFYETLLSGECTMLVVDTPVLTDFIQQLSKKSLCMIDNRPLGIVTTLGFGYSHYAIGVGTHLPTDTANRLSVELSKLMITGKLVNSYQGGTGDECGYIAFPQESGSGSILSVGEILGVVVGAVAAVTIPLFVWYRVSLQRQQRRYKKRFVQQIARNIAIGPRPGSIPPKKLSEQILHIANGKDTINKSDLAKWMMDIKMEFISNKDFNALWNAIDIEGTGEVDAVEFVVFLSACGPEFEKVYKEQENMPKMERLKLAARRLSNISHVGETGVRKIERQLESSGRFATSPATGSGSGCFVSSSTVSLNDNHDSER